MSGTATYEVERVVAAGGVERVFFKCPVGGYASLRPGSCPKCGELLMAVGAAPVSTDDHSEGHTADIARILMSDHEEAVGW